MHQPRADPGDGNRVRGQAATRRGDRPHHGAAGGNECKLPGVAAGIRGVGRKVGSWASLLRQQQSSLLFEKHDLVHVQVGSTEAFGVGWRLVGAKTDSGKGMEGSWYGEQSGRGAEVGLSAEKA